MSKTIPVLSAYQVGGCQAVYEVSVEYSRTRIQFGTPIGRFQRVQDHIINLVNQLDAARWTTNEALWKLDAGRPAADSVHLAKAVGSEAYLQACDHAHEVHAGVAKYDRVWPDAGTPPPRGPSIPTWETPDSTGAGWRMPWGFRLKLVGYFWLQEIALFSLISAGQIDRILIQL